MKLRISESNYLIEDIEAVKKYYPNIDDDTFMELISLDPTYRGKDSLGKYGKWILNLYNKKQISDRDFDDVTKILDQFTVYRNRIQNKDLNAYKTLDDLSDILAQVVDDDSMLSDRQKLRFKKNVKAGRISTEAEDDYDVVFEDNQYIVYVPNTHEASMKLGKGTEWCTAHENREWYDKYTKDGGKLYIIKDKATGDRWQYSSSTGDFLDDNDYPFDINDIIVGSEQLRHFICKMLGMELTDDTFVYSGGHLGDSQKQLIKNLIVSNGMSVVGYNAFADCANLVSVKITNSVKHIREGAFYNCKKLESVTLPDSLQTIGYSAFAGCESLKYIKIPSSVTEIGDRAFSGCINLQSIEIPDNVVHIGSFGFSYCIKLSSVILSSGIKSIDNSVFSNCKNLKAITLPNSVEKISHSAFEFCTNLESITIPGSVAVIGFNAFTGCEKLKNLKLLDGVEQIKGNAFNSCVNLKSATIPNSVSGIYEDAFTDCNNLTIYTNNEYVKDYCEENDIQCKPTSKSKTESLKLYISEDTACIPSKTSYMNEDGMKNGIYYFGDPKEPEDWRDVFKTKKRRKNNKDSE